MTDDLIEKRLDELVGPNAAVLASEVLEYCEVGTPIERLFLMGLLVRCRWDWFPYAVYRASNLASLGSLRELTCLHPRRPLCIFPQHPLKQYRADFLLAWARTPGDPESVAVIGVECDGHEFHEKTKQQARHDKSRDRTFLSGGVPVMRFTGSELYEAPVARAAEVLELFLDWRKSSELVAMKKFVEKLNRQQD